MSAFEKTKVSFDACEAPDAFYTLHAACYDETRRIELFFATCHATHTGDDGPVTPANKSTDADYVYSLKMSDNDNIAGMHSNRNAPRTMRGLGWIE